MIRAVAWQGRIIAYDLKRKNVKNINLRIYPDGRICISAHPRISDTTVEQFVLARAEAICRAMDRFEAARKNLSAPFTYSDGQELCILGRRCRLCVQMGEASVAMSDGKLMLTVPNPDDAEQRKKVLDSFLDSLCRQTVTKLCKEIYPSFAALGIDEPAIRFRRMKSRWGSCHLQKRVLTFNLSLIYEPIECIEYVVWHEFVHFLCPDHSPSFYATLVSFLPDWKARRNRLNKKTDA